MSDKLPQRLSEPFLKIDNEVKWLHTNWNLFRDLFGHSEQRIKFLNYSAEFFFGTLQRVLLDDVILGLTRLVDRNRDTLNRYVLVKSLESGKHPKLEAHLGTTIVYIESKMARLFEIRDNRIAHLNMNVATLCADSVLPGICRADIEQILLAIRNFLNAITLYFNDCKTCYELTPPTSDAETLLYTLKKAAGYDLAVKQGKLEYQFWEQTEFGNV